MTSAQKTALVTGSSRRIGAAVATTLHARGLRVAIHYRNSQGDARRLTDELNRKRADSAVAFKADLQQLAEVSDLGHRVVDKFGRLDVLVNNASVFPTNEITNTSADTFGVVFGIHVKAPFFLIQSVLPQLRTAGGAVVNITDIYAQSPLRQYSLYCASKAALESLTQSLALELAPDIRVNAVAPGAILAAENQSTPTKIKAPLRRMGTVEELAAAVAYLALDATYTSGQTLVVDGGRLVSTR